MDKNHLINKIKEIQGLTNDEKSVLLELLNTHKKYGLVWEDKPEDVEERLREELPVLKEVKERAIISEDKDAPNHILIEGDNLEALTSLCYTHEGKIDVIYIDPPYNTGNKDFVYNDSFVDKEDTFRHSKWLSFMSRRLKLAKQLLSDKGVIFISIDDNEASQLKLLCDEVFGESNFIGTIIQNKLNSKNDTINIQKNHEFIHCYRKSTIYVNKERNDKKTKINPNIILRNKIRKEVYKSNGNNFFYLNDPITTRGDGGTLNARQNLGYTFYYHPLNNDLIPIMDYDVELAKICNLESEVYTDNNKLINSGYVIIRPPKVRGKLGAWTWDIEKTLRDKNLLFIKRTKNGYSVLKRTFVPSDHVTSDNDRFYYEEIIDSNSRSIIDFSTNDGTNKFKSILGEDVKFNNPKNIDMIIYLLKISSSDKSIILDFFAGSGTTLHATMELNKDGGNRKCILVTNNENNICEEVTYERNKRVINGYTNPKGVEVEGLKNNNLRYYRTEFIPREQSMTNKRKLVLASTDLLCIKENIYTESKSFGNLKLKPTIARYFESGDNKMLIIYNEEAISYFVNEIDNMELNQPIKVYVFSPGQYAFDDDFFEVADKVTLCALPAAIYAAYKKVLPKRKDSQMEAIVESENTEPSSTLFSEDNMKGE